MIFSPLVFLPTPAQLSCKTKSSLSQKSPLCNPTESQNPLAHVSSLPVPLNRLSCSGFGSGGGERLHLLATLSQNVGIRATVWGISRVY